MPTVEYREGQAENIELKEESVDMVVAGASVHWFDLSKFFQEVKRVLKPAGCLTVFAYRIPEISLLANDSADLTRRGSYLLRTLLAYATIESPTNLAAQASLQNNYDDIFAALPFAQKKRIDDIHIVSSASIKDVCGYIRSVHIWKEFINRRIEEMKSLNIPITEELIRSFDLAVQFKTEIKKFWNLNDVNDDEKIMKLDYQVFVLLAAHPVNQ